MPRARTAEQAIRADWAKADKTVKETKAAMDAAAARLKDAMETRNQKRTAWEQARVNRKALQAALEALLGEKIQHEEESDGESAAPAAPGADAEVQLNGKVVAE